MRDKVAEFFEAFDTQGQVDELCGYYRELDTHLKNPISQIRLGTPDDYMVEKNGQRYFNVTKFFRIVYSLQYFHALISRLDEFFLSVEYFQGKVEFNRKTPPIPEEYSTRFFLNVCADSLRASLDIYAKFVGWFFDLRSKSKMGFSYNDLIKPLKKLNSKLYKAINALYKSDAYEYVKNKRDMEKHVGQQNFSMNLEELGKSFKIKIDKTLPHDHRGIAYRITDLYSIYRQLIHETIFILKSYDMGFDSPEDRISSIESDLRMKDLGKLGKLSHLRYLIG